ncbi:hypothetical protein [Flavobacterium sp.]|uniref:hypothetical protein n=1 Tax=Flavobacterium sp. TaxID=239 RepID=UPI00374CC678
MDLSRHINERDFDLENIKCDLALLEKEYNFYYVTDTFDIIEFCFPALYKKETSLTFAKSLASSYFAYDALFFPNKKEQKPIIFDEYRGEVFSIWDMVYKKHNEFSSKEKLEDLIHALKLGSEIDTNTIKEHINYIASLVIGTLSESTIEKFKRLVNKSLQLDRIELSDHAIEDSDIINEIVHSSPPSSNSITAFDSFCDFMKHDLVNLTYEEKFIYLESVMRDIKVFDRIININRKISESNTLKNKHLFIYLSSAPSRNHAIHRSFRENKLLPKIDTFENFSVLRNIRHFSKVLFINESIKNNSEWRPHVNTYINYLENKDEKQWLLEEIKDLELPVSFANFTREYIHRAKGLSDKYLRLYLKENEFNLKIEKAISKFAKNRQDNTDLLNLLYILKEDIQKDSVDNQSLNLAIKECNNSLVDQINYLRHFSDNSQNIKEQIALKSQKIVPGKDVIRSSIQLFPVLIGMENKNLGLTTDHEYEILNLIFNLSVGTKRGIVHRSGSRSTIRRHISSLGNNVDKRVFSLFLDLITPEGTNIDSVENSSYVLKLVRYNNSNEPNAINELTELLSICKKTITKYGIVKMEEGKERLDFSFSAPQKTEIDIIYFLSWLFRRSREYDKALGIINSCLEKNPEEPRLLHSRALIHISEIYENKIDLKGNAKIIEKYLNAIEDLTKAKTKFAELSRFTYSKLVEHVIIGIENTIIDAYAQLYIISNRQINYLRDARKMLNYLKTKLTLYLNEDFISFPSYNHTEVDLEYCECIFLESIGKRSLAKIKISFAKERLDLMNKMNFLNDYVFFNETQKNVSDMYEKLVG